MEVEHLSVSKPPPEQSSSSNSIPRKIRRQREAVAVACDNCRKRKTACGGERPACALCKKKGILCQYQVPFKDEKVALKESVRQLQQDKEKLQQELDILRQSSGTDQRVPTAKDVSFTLERLARHRDRAAYAIEKRSLTQFPSAIASARAILPPIYSEIEMLFHVQYPLAYPLARQQMRSNVREVHSFVYGLVVANNSRVSLKRGYQKDHSEGIEKLDHSQGQSHESKTSFYSALVDSSLYNVLREENINIRRWTDIPIPRKYILGGIKLYLETDHPVLGILDTKLFLRDFVSGSSNFCSSFLVNSFLAYVLLPHLANQDGQSLLYKAFQAQAIKDWQEQDVNVIPDHITTMAGLLFLSISLTQTFDGELGQKLLRCTVDLATRLRLFNTPDLLSIEEMGSENGETKQAVSQCAWGTYNVIALYAMNYCIDSIDYAPILPLPERYEDSKIYLQLGESIHGVSIGTSQAFVGMCKLCLHIAGMHSDRSKDADQLQLALSRFNNILAIQDELTDADQQKQDVKADILIFHIWYHTIIMDLFRPFILETRQRGFYKPVESPTLPEAVFSASLKQLQDLVLEFSMNHLDVPHSGWWHGALLYVANAALCDLSNPDWLPLFLLCIRCYQNTLSSYPIMIGFLKALLAMAIEKKALKIEQVRSILAPYETNPSPSNTFGIFTIDLDKALVLPDKADVHTLASQIDDMDVFDRFTQDVL